MRRIVTFLLCCAALCACDKPDPDALFVEATLTLEAPAGVVRVVRFQGAVALKNLNTGERIVVSDIADGRARVRLVKGVYLASADGTLLMQYVAAADGRTRIGEITLLDTTVALTGEGQTVVLRVACK